MQQYTVIYLLQNHSTGFGCPWPIGHVGGRSFLRYYDPYQSLQLQFYVLLTMGAMDTGNMYEGKSISIRTQFL